MKKLFVMVILAFFVFLVVENMPKQEENTTKTEVQVPQKIETPKVVKKETIQFSTNRLESFSKAKSILEKNVYTNELSKTFYCSCDFKGKNVDLKSCGYNNIKEKMLSRAKKIEWEHIVPAENFGKSFSEWKEWHADCVDSKGEIFNGRKCAEKINQNFRIMQADIYNLVPAIGEVNGLRSNYDMSVKMNAESYNFCKGVELYPEYNLFSPSDDKKGDIARIYLYMLSAYPQHISYTQKYKDMLEKWNVEDPISTEECAVYQKKKEIAWYSVYIWEDFCMSK